MGEAAQARCWVLRERASCPPSAGPTPTGRLESSSTRWFGAGNRPYLENYTVDASINSSVISAFIGWVTKFYGQA